jgi:hypothetical protein
VILEDKETFVEVVHDLNEERKKCSSVLGSNVFRNVLDDTIIKDISDDLEHIFNKDYIIENFAVFDEKFAFQILNVIQDIFMDIDETDIVYLQHAEWDEHNVDFYFEDVPACTMFR